MRERGAAGSGEPVSAADVEAFARDGVVCLRGLVPSTWIDELAQAMAAVLPSSTADLTELAPPASTDAQAGGPTGRFRAGTDQWREHETFARFATASPIPGAVATLLGSSQLVLYEDSVLVKEPGAGAATVWHQDLGYFHCEGAQIATTWCALDPVDADSGALRYVIGSHRWGRLFRPNLFVTSEPIPGTEGEAIPDVDATIDPSLIASFDTEPGDVIVHHAATLHAAGPNRRAARARRAVSDRYCGADAVVRIRPGSPLKPQQRLWRDGMRVLDLAGTDFPMAKTH